MVDTGSPLFFFILTMTRATMATITNPTPSVDQTTMHYFFLQHTMHTITTSSRIPAAITMMSQSGRPMELGTSISVLASRLSHQSLLLGLSQSSSSSPPNSPFSSSAGHSWTPSHLREKETQFLLSLQQNLGSSVDSADPC